MEISVSRISGSATVFDKSGLSSSLQDGDVLSVNDIISVSLNSRVEIKVSEGHSLLIDSLQVVKLTVDMFIDTSKELAEVTENSLIPKTLKHHLLSGLYNKDNTILAREEEVFFLDTDSYRDALPVGGNRLYEGSSLKDLLVCENSLSKDLLSFDQLPSNKSTFLAESLVSDDHLLHEYKAITIDAIGYDSQQLLSFLLDNYPELNKV